MTVFHTTAKTLVAERLQTNVC